MTAVNWRRLEVYEADGYLGHLGELVEDAPANLDTCELAQGGSIDTWPNHMVAAPGEEHGWDTPRVAVDWTGFREALQAARGDEEVS